MKGKGVIRMSKKANTSWQARQGDIFFEVRDEATMPKNLKKKTDRILAYGEVTGHMHQITEPALDQLDMRTDEKGDIWVYSENTDIKVFHDEHDPIVLPQQKWICISRQREYDPLAAEKERRVAD